MQLNNILKGVIISPGIGVGHAYVLRNNQAVDYQEPSDTDSRIALFNRLIKNAMDDLSLLQGRAVDDETLEIINVQQSLLDDVEFKEAVIRLLKNGYKLRDAIHNALAEYGETLAKSSPYFRERAIDIQGLENVLLGSMSGGSVFNIAINDAIVICKELDPFQALKIAFAQDKVKGVIVEEGGASSHAAILLRSAGIPTLFKVSNITAINDGESLVVDALRGFVIIDPSPDVINRYTIYKLKIEDIYKKSFDARKMPSKTIDNIGIDIMANVNNYADLELAIRNDADGIGLLRTEFIFMNEDSPPSEEEQYEVYKYVLSRMKNKTVIIRLLDIGGEKMPAYLKVPQERNPQLGMRGIRLLLRQERDLLTTQLRAIIRASKYNSNGAMILIPMVVSAKEVVEVKMIINELLNNDRIEHGRIGIGAMIETPAAALLSGNLMRELDFVSIGTNDLSQYTLAVDRESTSVGDLYSQFSPAVIKLIGQVAENGHKLNIKVGVCGEAASDPLMVPILVGLGVDSLSSEPVNVPLIKHIIRNIKMREAINLAKDVMDAPDPEIVREESMKFIKDHGIELPQLAMEEDQR